MAPDTADIAAAIGLARDRELPLAVRGGTMHSKEDVMDITGRARDLFRGAERQAAADFGIEMSERILPIGEPVGQARVIESGTGRPVLFVHGGGGLANHWFPLMAHLDGYRLIAVDRPGCGLTDGFDYSRAASLRQHAVTFLTHVVDAAGLGAVDIVANSMGALWSLWLAADRPERVRSLALLGCSALVAGTSAPLAMRIVSRRGLGWVLERPASDRSIRQAMARFGHTEDIADALPPSFVQASVLGANLPGASASWRSMLWRCLRLRGARPDAIPGRELRAVKVSPLAIWGDHDPFGDQDAARRFAASVNASLVFAGRGHLPWLDQPQQIAALIRDHLASTAEHCSPISSEPIS